MTEQTLEQITESDGPNGDIGFFLTQRNFLGFPKKVKIKPRMPEEKRLYSTHNFPKTTFIPTKTVDDAICGYLARENPISSGFDAMYRIILFGVKSDRDIIGQALDRLSADGTISVGTYSSAECAIVDKIEKPSQYVEACFSRLPPIMIQLQPEHIPQYIKGMHSFMIDPANTIKNCYETVKTLIGK
ncbi:MAG: hypothetical protein Q8O89_07490 [Nanoarchaeota archaeon]|nr:hypothetical protein [Nanoarchaeota archaeon]